MVQWLRIRAPSAGGTDLIPGLGPKIPHVPPPEKKNNNKMCSGFVLIKYDKTCRYGNDCHKGKSFYIHRSLEAGGMAHHTGPHVEAPRGTGSERKAWLKCFIVKKKMS